MKEPNFRAEANRLISIHNLPPDSRMGEYLASLVSLYNQGMETGFANGFKEGVKQATIGAHHLPSGRIMKIKESL